MRYTVNFVFLFFCYHVVVIHSLSENGTNRKLPGFQTLNVNNARFSNSARNPFHKIGNRRYRPEVRNYHRSSRYNFPNFYTTYGPPNLPYFSPPPIRHRPKYVKPSLYNVFNSYKTAPLIRSMKHSRTDKRKHILDEVEPVYPAQDVKFQKRLNDRLAEPAADVKNIIENAKIRNNDFDKSSQKQYIVHPNGTVEDMDNLEPVLAEHPNYVLVNGADIIPTYNESSLNLSDYESLQQYQLEHENETPTYIIQVNGEEPVQNTDMYQNHDDSVTVLPSIVFDSNTSIINTPTIIIESNPQFMNSSGNSVANTQTEGEANILLPVDISKDIMSNADLSERYYKINDSLNLSTKSSEELLNLSGESDISFNPFINFEDKVVPNSFDHIKNNNISNPVDENASHSIVATPSIETDLVDDFHNLFISSEVNETNPNEKNDVGANKFIDQEPTIEDGSVDNLNISTILTNDTNIPALHSEQEYNLFHEIHIPLEADTESNFHDEPYQFHEDFNNETSNQFPENQDTYPDNGDDRFVVNSTQTYNEHILHILPLDNPAEIVQDQDLLTDQEIDESELTTSAPWAEVDIFETSTMPDIPTLADDVNPTTREQQTVHFKIDRDFWEKLKNNEIPFDVVYFFQVQDPVIEKDVKTVVNPDGTVVTYETVREIKEDNQPLVVKNIDIIDPEILN